MSQLFSPIQLGQQQLANRIAVAPMCQYSAQDGEAGDWHLMHLGQLAMSGAGLLILEATAVSPEGRITPGDLGLYSDRTEAALGRVMGALRQYSDIRLGIQLAHAGRKASSDVPWRGGQLLAVQDGGWTPLAPSAIAHGANEPTPAALDDAGLTKVLHDFVAAAERTARLGFDVVELHAAHGYLLHQFLSPLANQRTDPYGGTPEKRMAFVLQVFDAVRAVLPASTALGVRLSATDWVPGGWDPEQSAVLCQALESRGCDFVHISSGGLSTQQKIPVGPGYQVPLAAKIREQVRMPVIAVGMITEAAQAEAIVASGQADMVALARAMLYNPRWPWHAAAQLGATVQAPRQYWRCQPAGQRGLFGDIAFGQR